MATQNKLIYAITRQTAAELIVARADSNLPNMGLTSWKGNIVRQGDVVVAKNYLQAEEIEDLNRLVEIFLTSAELRVKGRQDLTLQYWRKNVDNLLDFQDKPLLKGKGKITAAQMEAKVKAIYQDFNTRRKMLEAQKADEEDQTLFDDLDSIQDALPSI